MVGRKRKDSRGETLVELLASILIAALSVALLFTCCMTAAAMGRDTNLPGVAQLVRQRRRQGGAQQLQLRLGGQLPVGGLSRTVEFTVRCLNYKPTT